jgi:hypothetical protein
MLAQAFPHGRFQPPATIDAIEAAEKRLGVQFPSQLRELYLQCDGFCEPAGNASYLLPLEYAVDETEKLWTLHEVLVETKLPDFRPFVFFGSPSAGGWWGIRLKAPHDLIAWDHQMLYEPDMDFEAAGSNIIDAFEADYALHDTNQPK